VRESVQPVSFRHRSLPRSTTITAHAEATAAAEAAATAIADKKGEDILLLDVSELVVVTDVFVIATGTSTRHVKSLVEEVELQLKSGMERRVLRREGEDFGKWVLLDYGDVIVHVFDRETRDYYELERLWADAPATEIESAAAEA
jgi:ribosome-associated protein